MPGPPTSGSAGCAIARPQGLQTGLDEERVGIGPPSGLPRIPRETGEAPAACRPVRNGWAGGHFQAGSLCRMPVAAPEKGRLAAFAAEAARGPGCIGRRVRRRAARQSPCPPVPWVRLFAPRRLSWPGSRQGAWPVRHGRQRREPCPPAPLMPSIRRNPRQPAWRPQAEPDRWENEPGLWRVACWRAPARRKGATAVLHQHAGPLPHFHHHPPHHG
jgi:hypothetical protein